MEAFCKEEFINIGGNVYDLKHEWNESREFVERLRDGVDNSISTIKFTLNFHECRGKQHSRDPKLT
jgi:hypothetical protein